MLLHRLYIREFFMLLIIVVIGLSVVYVVACELIDSLNGLGPP